MNLSFKHIAPLISHGKNGFSKWLSYIGLGIGVLLLLVSIQMFININQLLKGSSPRKTGYDFISISKTITNETMGQEEKNLFNQADVEDIRTQSFVEDAAPLVSNQFRVQASAQGVIPFSTDLFIEAIDKDFLDTVPPGFTWAQGDDVVPIVLSSDFLEMYNVFAPGQGLPQVSKETITSLQIALICHGPFGRETYTGRIMALSDRINSFIVPVEFLNWANKAYGNTESSLSSRVYVKTKDANDPSFLNYLEEKNYSVNKDKTRFGRIKQLLQLIVSGLGVFGMLVVALALLLFSYYLELLIARSRDNLQLLMTLGYSPSWLSKTVARRWIPVYTTIILAAVIICALLHYAFSRYTTNIGGEISPLLNGIVWITSIALLVLSIIANFRTIKKQLYKIN